MADEQYNMEESRERVGKFYSLFPEIEKKADSLILENIQGRRVLEIGATELSYSFRIAQKGGFVTGINVSESIVKRLNEVSKARMFRYAEFQCKEYHKSCFHPGTFDLVCGLGVLQLSDKEQVLAEVSRVLKPEGKAVFIEPLGHNRFINAFRRRTGKLRPGNQKPMLLSDIVATEKYFEQIKVKYFHFFTIAATIFCGTVLYSPVYKIMRLIDKAAFGIFPGFRKFAWYAMIEMEAPKVNPTHKLQKKAPGKILQETIFNN
ncbi:MAG: class I SAM-dependent methyltransferase [Bacteroidetes bacterium]|nr:class I SAM-dependent methyltransferase [Bacteroidota bacterium]MBU1718507.1 class I SAM-dependent methyltransferase [Bacteroidota bacterium]